MAIHIYGDQFNTDGHAKTMEGFRMAHGINAAGLLNHAEGKDVNAYRPPYEPNHPDNQWPIAMHHPHQPFITVGENLKGLMGPRRREAEANNQALVERATASGYRKEPYPKPKVAVYDPAIEKAEQLRREAHMQGQIAFLTDVLMKSGIGQPPLSANPTFVQPQEPFKPNMGPFQPSNPVAGPNTPLGAAGPGTAQVAPGFKVGGQ